MRILSGVLRFIVCSCTLCVLGVSGFAQTETATVSGRVTDPQGQVVPGVQIQIVNVDTNIVLTTKTNSDGLYVIGSVHPGNYRILVLKDGFKEVVKTGLVLHVQDVVAENFSLQVGSVSQSLTVTADALSINTSDASVSTVIDRNLVENLPMNGRSFNTLIQLTPGVVLSQYGFNVNGQRDSTNYYSVDGVSANFGIPPSGFSATPGQGPATTSFGGTNSLLSIDSLQEFRIQTSSFAPEYGRTPGGQIEVTTRSGTNAIHGDLFDYFRNDALDANDWFYDAALATAPPGTLSRPMLRQNDFGGVVGGPIVKNKTFFFLSYEGLRLDQPEVQFLSVPDLATRQSVPSPLNGLLNAFPLPNGMELGNGFAAYTETASARQQLNVGAVKIDQTIGSKITLFGRFSYASSSAQIPYWSQLSNQSLPTQFVTLGTNIQISSRIIDQLRFNYSSTSSVTTNSLTTTGGAVIPDISLLIPPPYSPATTGGALAVFSNDYSSDASVSAGFGSKETSRQFNIVDDLSDSVDKHLLKFGFDYRKADLGFDLGGSPNLVSFAIIPTISDLMAGGTSIFAAYNDPPARFLESNWSVYAQDTWRMVPRVVLTYGLRWDVDPGPKGTKGTQFVIPVNFDSNNFSSLSGKPGTQLWHTQYENIAPRVGLAATPFGTDRITLRSGFGVFYDPGTTNVAFFSEYPFININSPSSFVPLPLTSPSQYVPAVGSLYPPYSSGFYVYLTNPNLKLAYSLQWNEAIEVAGTKNDTLSLTYVGQAGRRLLRFGSLASNPNANFTSNPPSITDNGSRSNYDALQVQYRHRMSHGLQVLANYTWSHSLDDASSNLSNGGPFSLLAISRNYSNSDFDVRQNFSLASTYDIPNVSHFGLLNAALNGWGIDTIIYARTGFPIDVLQTDPGSQFIPLGQSRPDVVPGQPFWVSDPTAPGGKRINPNAFSYRAPDQQGTLGRNAIPGFGYTQWDASIRRTFALMREYKLILRLDLFNALNHPNFANPQPNYTSGATTDPQFGVATQMLNQALPGLSSIYQNGGPRSLQVSLKFLF
jgi:hypothetical protein